MTEQIQSLTLEALQEQSAMIGISFGLKKQEITMKLNKLAGVDPKLMCVLEEAINDALNMATNKSYFDGMIQERKANLPKPAEEKAPEAKKSSMKPKK